MEKKTASTGSNYKIAQTFGYKGPGEKVLEEDIISVVKHDSSGNYLAIGDKAGRIIIFQVPTAPKQKDEQLNYFTEFQSHNREFDCLRSVDVDEEILAISWLPSQGKYHKLLSTNSRTIKLWKIFEKADKKLVRSAGHELNMPKMKSS
jgi:serine/threonine-protein phosphatase 2A regulatory subunit B